MTLAGIILVAVGILFLVVAVVTGMGIRRFLSSAVATDGKVVGFVKQSSGSEGGTSTHAQVQYSTAAGETVTFTEKSQTFGSLSVDAAVPVKYDPGAPKKARIATTGRLWATTIVLAGLGVALLIVGVVLAVVGD
jgi:hypothetical protein